MDADRDPTRQAAHFAELDYCYGAGSLWMRVERIEWTRPVEYNGETWYEVDGIEVTSDGREIGRRQALVRSRRLTAFARDKRS
jgi:hypothetical protein